MSRRPVRAGLVVACATAIMVCTAAPAMAKNVYHWVTEDGTLAWSDAPKRIPARYKAKAKPYRLRSIRGYERWTPADAQASGAYAQQLSASLERLREVNAQPAPHPMHGMHRMRAMHPGGQRVVVRTGRRDRPGVEVQLGVHGERAPLVVEEMRARSARSDATRSVTVVRRGDDVLALIKGHENQRRTVQVDERTLGD